MAPNRRNRSSTQPSVAYFASFLFDLDGTLINTTEAITNHWKSLAADLGTDAATILRTSRGRRSIDTIDVYKPEMANREYIRHIESQIPTLYGSTATLTAGTTTLLNTLTSSTTPFAIVTSCTRALLQNWLSHLSLPSPAVTVTAEDIEAGKPDPACYRLSRERLDLPIGARVLVVENAPAGVRAGKRARCRVLAVATTHDVRVLRDAGADWVVRDLREVSIREVEGGGGGWRVEIEDVGVDGSRTRGREGGEEDRVMKGKVRRSG